MCERRNLFLRLCVLLALQNGLLAAMALHLSPSMPMAMMAMLAAGVIAIAMATAMMATRLAGIRSTARSGDTPARAKTQSAGPYPGLPTDIRFLTSIPPRSSMEIDHGKTGGADGSGEKLDQAQSALASLDSGLRRLAAGELRARIETPMAPEFEALRCDFNRGIASLDESMMAIGGSTDTLHDLCTQARFELSRQRCIAIDDIPLLAASDDTLQDASLALRDQMAVLDSVAATGADARARLERECDAFDASKSALAEVAGDNGKVGTIVSLMREVAFRISMLSVDLSSAASDTAGAGDRFKPMASELRGLAEDVTKAATQASIIERQATLAVRETTSALDRGKREIGNISREIETAEGRLRPVSQTCAEAAEKLSRTGAVLSEMALSKGQQSSFDKLWETTLEGMTRELHVIGRNCSRFMPVTVLRENPPSDGRPPASGRHLRLVKS
jgi:hypothetical protein